MDWKQYETEIFELFHRQYPDAEITLDAKKSGLYSKVERQVDVLIEQYIAGNRFTLVIDGKYFNKKVDVKAVESFIGMLEDIGAHKGLLISNQGFSEAAYNRAHFGPSEVELDILNFKDLHQFQAHGAMPYAGENIALVPAPFGWVIDAQPTPAWLATLYQQGLTIDKAIDKNEFMYIQFWDRKAQGDSLDDLLKLQLSRFEENDPDTKIEYLPTIKRQGQRTCLRKATINNYPSSEFTGFIEFSDFIFFCVMFTPENRERQNIRKLENILKLVKAGKVKHKKATKKFDTD
ncbi:restriction endonuclease [Psychrosphaera ytuae]|uniref:Restriction endonuclease n=1 Tax=Psychrosphaera ytuae TaxID=2820710 RepID=A0A975DBT5_9GAMM|nr:restriction endonuclease [Psychrosphaera ytuae]QTH64265.1 restriction endonuclease [Psychrosphaera ytuae]